MVSTDWITSVVIRGESLRIRVPGAISLVAINPFPFPGMDSSLHRFSLGEDESKKEESAPFVVALAGEGESEGEVSAGVILFRAREGKAYGRYGRYGFGESNKNVQSITSSLST